ncbi:B-cell receptor CD22 [Misgurnus anguillicaudatus]|uniref:B-cell receptor CD22 n=1 Tax=Misgurnus anguillicaudatus TaxID=75329 RepID=UPI003CCF0329
MSIKIAPPLPLILLLVFPGVSSDVGWVVNYSSSKICALEGSSVIIPCTYKYPAGYEITKAFWTKNSTPTGIEPLDLSEDSEYSQRIQYLGDKYHRCAIRLTDLRKTDSHKYYFRFITNITNGKWTGTPGVTLTVTDLQVETQQRVKEGDSLTLTCKSRCSLPDRSTFIWFKNTQSLSERKERNNELILQSVTREDAGRYSCSVQGNKLISSALYLNVMYSPRKVLVGISPSGEIVEGDSVSLSCSSDANPPVYQYRWIRGNLFVGFGKTYSIKSIRSDQSGEYKCKVFNEIGWKYSKAVILNVMYPPRNVSLFMNGSGEIMEGDSVNLICSSESNPPVQNYTWFKENETSSVGSGQIFTAMENGWFYCVAENKHGFQRSAAVAVILGGKYIPLYLIAGGIGAFGGLVFVFIILFFSCAHRKKKQRTNNIRGMQDNDTEYEVRLAKMNDDLGNNAYTNFIPACNVFQEEGISSSSAEADDRYDTYRSYDTVHASSEDVYCIPDTPPAGPSDGIYMNFDPGRSFASDHFKSNVFFYKE